VRRRVLEYVSLDEAALPSKDNLVLANAIAKRRVLILDMKEPGDESANVRRDFDQQFRFLQTIAVFAAGVSIADEVFCKHRVGLLEFGEECAIDGFDSADAV
jgi:hypothetical protein